MGVYLLPRKEKPPPLVKRSSGRLKFIFSQVSQSGETEGD
ncbi:hypothetical protein POREN0001_0646 [Porphyromonas endodontalis ATCC 35406]|uniref:Uncharacterized protein n=1 Tax=Porphyromonas endodontalis (strain ATCC 35406 / DSM 24491 / JCM 8526 / CCUG 16442 / BCRC 14492 / NCTC 13058 / HG 370) TaxID=553175 RepID=C3J8X5_POREA|nr:hypothetical protein POREN0001_0646 [Porphyromonas endodontalis ATCC 35406]